MNYLALNLAKALWQMIKENPDNKEKIISQFINFLKNKNIVYLFDSIIKYFKKEALESEEKQTLRIRAKNSFSKEIINKIKKVVKADKNVNVDFQKDKEIIGGFIAEYDNKIYDTSINYQLGQLKKQLSN
ncbi:F0F1 ATP synthase subunit delta [Patescibacteria group bacterium]|nr:F0F1 ATP synthase subunit delta [Patescibacteria group bacterium]